MPLTDTTVRNAKPSERARRLFDERGLYLEIAPAGGKWWRFKYRVLGREKRLSLGVYPDTSLKQARERRDEARRLVASGVDPSSHRKALRASRKEQVGNSFEVVAREWYQKQADGWVAKHADRVLARLEKDVLPWLGHRPVAGITPPEILAVIRRIEGRGAVETAHRVLAICGQVLRYAIATGRAPSDPSRDLRGALTPAKPTHLAAVTEPKQVAELLKALDGYEGTFAVTCALKLAPLVFVRPGELRQARWADIDLDAAEWRFIASKTEVAHIVPLSTQAVGVLRELNALTGSGTYVFPSARSARRPMSDNAVLAALRRIGIPKERMSGHGFRAMARTILDEVLGFRPDLIEHQLAHAVRDPHGRAYNRTQFLPERRQMMQAWADYLGQLKRSKRP